MNLEILLMLETGNMAIRNNMPEIACEIFQKTLRFIEEKQPENKELIIATVNNLAACMFTLEKMKEAEELLMNYLPLLEEIENEELIRSFYFNLSAVLIKTKSQNPETYLRKAIMYCKSEEEMDAIKFNTAYYYIQTGKKEEGEELLLKLLESKQDEVKEAAFKTLIDLYLQENRKKKLAEITERILQQYQKERKYDKMAKIKRMLRNL